MPTQKKIKQLQARLGDDLADLVLLAASKKSADLDRIETSFKASDPPDDEDNDQSEDDQALAALQNLSAQMSALTNQVNALTALIAAGSAPGAKRAPGHLNADQMAAARTATDHAPIRKKKQAADPYDGLVNLVYGVPDEATKSRKPDPDLFHTIFPDRW